MQFFVLPHFRVGGEMTIMATGRSFSYSFDSGASFHSNDSRFFYFATRTGISYIGPNNVTLWQYPFVFNNPWMSARGNFVAVGELRGGMNIYVFNENGRHFSISLDSPIYSFWVNETGLLSVIVRYDGGYGIYVFNEHRTTAINPLFRLDMFYDLVFPTRVEVSPDGRYVAIAMKDLNVSVRSVVQFRYINQRDAWNTDQGHFATEDFYNESVTALRFMNDNRLIIGTTARIACFQLGPRHATVRYLWTIQLENQKTHIEFFNGTHFAFVTGPRIIGVAGEGDPVGRVRIYGLSRNQLGYFDLGRRATHLRMGHNSVIVGGDRSFHAMDFRGTPLWEHTSLFDTRDVLFLDNTNTLLIAGSNRAEIFERRRIREGYREFEFEFGTEEVF